MKVYFISIGGSVMHNLAMALKLKGYDVSGSDDEIFEPAKSNLEKLGLLPDTLGWNSLRITRDIDSVILGMHARADNPELKKARELGLKIYSFPEFLYEQSKSKTRVVIAGSHGKTTITAMVMHILKKAGRDFDYMVGSSVRGFDITVRLSDEAPVIILEGDEYPDSAINQTPKFLLYQPDIVLISGIAWDHINVFPEFESYVEQFRKLVEMIPFDGSLVYNSEDKLVGQLAGSVTPGVKAIPYATPEFEVADGRTFLPFENQNIKLNIFGRHNLQNMMGAIQVVKTLGVDEAFSLEAMKDFSGAARRLELAGQNDHCSIFRDFAHAPSKLKATISAVKEQYPERKLIACFELHTYSSLNRDFLREYFDSMNRADVKVIFFNAHTFELKKMDLIEPAFIRQSFGDQSIQVYTDKESLIEFLRSQQWSHSNLLMMSSGNFDNLDLNEVATFVLTPN